MYNWIEESIAFYWCMEKDDTAKLKSYEIHFSYSILERFRAGKFPGPERSTAVGDIWNDERVDKSMSCVGAQRGQRREIETMYKPPKSGPNMKPELQGLPKQQVWVTHMIHMSGRRCRREVLGGNTEFNDTELRSVIHREVP